MGDPKNLLTEWSTILMQSMADSGVRDLVVSPGSRSTPFLAAALRSPLRLHDAIDERAAGFLALGMARATGTPVALLCSSGTAGAHYYPAVIEASLARVPLLVLTADRPNELQECDAAQTIDQLKLFASYARLFLDLGCPASSPTALVALRRTVAQSVATSRYPIPGPVHLNARARKPLEPVIDSADDDDARLHATVKAILDTPIVAASFPTREPDAATIAKVAERCGASERGVIVCGPAPLRDASHRRDLFALARATGFALFSETTSQMRLALAEPDVTVCDAFDLVLRAASTRPHVRPEVVLQFGRTPTSSAWESLAGSRAMDHVVFTETTWTDPMGSARQMSFGDTGAQLRALVAELGRRRVDRSKGSAWRTLFDGVHRDVSAAVDAELGAEPTLGEGTAVRTVVEMLPADSVLVTGNSLPIRHLDTFARRRAGDIGVICQRGANGIDGLVAGTAGTSRSLERPVTLLIGDVSFLHDVSSLMLLAKVTQPVVIAVLQNFGGRIFEQLPLADVARRSPADAPASLTLEHIVAEHSWDLAQAAAMFRVAHRRVATRDELRAALGDAYAEPRTTVIEIMVPAHGVHEQMSRIKARVAEILARPPA